MPIYKWFLAQEKDGYLHLAFVARKSTFTPVVGNLIPDDLPEECSAPSSSLICYVYDRAQNERLSVLLQFVNKFGGDEAEFWEMARELIHSGASARARGASPN